MNICKLTIICVLFMSFETVFAGSLLPTQIGKIVIDKPIPYQSTGKLDKFPIYDLPVAESYAMWENFVGQIGEDILADLTHVHIHQNKVASIVFTFRDPTFHATKNLLSKKFGSGFNRKIKGSEACNNIEITTWRGVDSTLMLAVVGGQPGYTRVFAFLKLRSNALYPSLRKELDKVPPPDDGECDWHADNALGQP